MPSPLENALERIELCRQNQSLELDLSDLALKEVPDPVFDLFWLESLDISYREDERGDVTVLPKSIRSLKKLKNLNFSNQAIFDLLPISSLRDLQKLSFDMTLVSNLKGISSLHNLEYLSFSSTAVSDVKPISSLKKLKYLDFSYTQVSELYPLRALVSLQYLDLNGTYVADLKSLKVLGNIIELYCENMPIESLTPIKGLKKLKKFSCNQSELINDLKPLSSLYDLQVIDISSTNINDLSPLKNLKNLRELKFSETRVSDLSCLIYIQSLECLRCIGIPAINFEPINTLKNLQELSCMVTRLMSLEQLNKLSNLKILDCSYTWMFDLTQLSALKSLRVLDCQKSQIRSLDSISNWLLQNKIELHLAGNPIKHIPEVLLGTAWSNCYENLIHYYQALKQGYEWRKQIKIQLIGNGRVGKTSVAYALKHKQGCPPDMESTHGITIEEWQQTDPDTNDPITWQLWDFGGQEIYHSTHRLFLSNDCVYLLVWTEQPSDSEDEINHPMSYWQEAIHDLAPNSPVILVKNKSDQSNTLPHCPTEMTTLLKDQKPVQYATVSSLYYTGFNTLHGTIQDVIESLAGQIYLKLPKSWLRIEEGVKALKSSQKMLSFSAFVTLCEKHGVEYADWFADYLHKTGVFFYRKDAFQNQIILDQNWLIEAVYKVFDRKAHYRAHLLNRGGKLSGFETSLIWSEVTEQEREIYLNFMRDCHICYESSHEWDTPFAQREYMIPVLLPEQTPAQAAWGKVQDNDWLYIVNYSFLHRSIIERLIVRFGETYKGLAQPWRTGIWCQTEWGQLLLECVLFNRAESNHGELHFSLRGEAKDHLLYAVRKLVHEISPHKRYTETLQKNNTASKPLPTFEERNYMTSRLDESTEKKAIKVFISYSKEDKEHRLELEKRLKIISRQFQVHAWTDAQLMAGGLVHDDIKQELVDADIVLLLLSPDFIATDYCYDIELPLALERYRAQKNIVIPIILRNTPDWADAFINGFKLGDITALPTKGKPLKQWNDKDDFWADVQSGIKNCVKNLLEA